MCYKTMKDNLCDIVKVACNCILETGVPWYPWVSLDLFCSYQLTIQNSLAQIRALYTLFFFLERLCLLVNQYIKTIPAKTDKFY